ncbi:unnamed protein product [Phyllotreta striolata]|uniref:Protein misato n=1 Tax=Phyllotreta striolata TaxID=444603 RepID=A0A9N9TAC5_PHYSR|nr:unnamed protein product [Phyllotreta striolata]
MSGREILTLQFGHYANFVGTHWWNLQDLSFNYDPSTPSEINHDVLYREGQTSRGEVTFTPRLLLADLKGSFGSLSEEGDLYKPNIDPNNVQTNWNTSQLQVKHVEQRQPKNDFLKDLENPAELSKIHNKEYNFETTAKVWSDFLYSRFHPRTVEVIREYQHCNENTPFDAFTLGSAVWKTPQFAEDFSDRIRNYIEECDNFQGFHLITDCTNAFSGLSSSCLEFIGDEYNRKSVLVIPVIPSHFSDNDINSEGELAQSVLNDSVRVINLALSFNEFYANSSLFVPLCAGSKGWRQPGPKRSFKNVEYNNKLAYHSSAILAAALDTFTLKHRLKSSPFTLSDLAADLTHSGRKAAAASVNLPFPMGENSDLLESLDNCHDPLYYSITPNCHIGTRRAMQHITIRGIKEERLKKPLNKAEKQRELPAYRTKDIKEMMTMYLAYSTETTASIVTVGHEPLVVRSPFPQIFTKNLTSNGFLSNMRRSNENKVESIPLLAGLHCCTEVGKMIESLYCEAKKLKINRYHEFASGGLDKDSYEESLDNLFTLSENYDDNCFV